MVVVEMFGHVRLLVAALRPILPQGPSAGNAIWTDPLVAVRTTEAEEEEAKVVGGDQKGGKGVPLMFG